MFSFICGLRLVGDVYTLVVGDLHELMPTEPKEGADPKERRKAEREIAKAFRRLVMDDARELVRRMKEADRKICEEEGLGVEDKA